MQLKTISNKAAIQHVALAGRRLAQGILLTLVIAFEPLDGQLHMDTARSSV